MSSPVKLYVYDLSRGMARQLSRQLTGRQIDGIWHTSVVVFGKEIFYGQGIDITTPGGSHHGQPLTIVDMGETSLDEETFNEYLEEMRQHYTADKVLSLSKPFTINDIDVTLLAEFNCNSFSDDCIGFLTGQSIPSYIKDLPTDFLSTPFGAALRPTIDAMYRRPTPGPIPTPASAAAASPDPQLASAILQAVAAQAQGNGTAQAGSKATESLASPIHIVTNPASFNGFLKTHKASVALFTSKTCPPCRVIEPVFERLAEEKGIQDGKDGAAFAKIDIDVGMGNALASQWNVRATPTFMFFLNGQKLDELKGANANELRSQVDLLLFQAYPPHPHTSLSMPAVQALSTNAIIFSQVPAIDTVLAKLSSFIDEQPTWPDSSKQSKATVKTVLSSTVQPYLKSRFQPPNPAPNPLPSASPTVLAAWTETSAILVSVLPVESLFPLVDMWRLAFLDPAVGTWTSNLKTASSAVDPVSVFLPKAIGTQDTASKGARNYTLTVLRLLCNAFSSTALAQTLLRNDGSRGQISSLLIPTLLHSDPLVRTAASSLAFNVAAVLQKQRIDSVRSGKGIKADSEDYLADWEVEITSAIIEAIDREKENEEVVHRLTAALAFYVRLSPQYESQLQPLLEVLQSRQLLKSKLAKGDGWNSDGGITKKDIRKLVEEVAGKLCA
ncbi:Desumoylating isopeptidase 1 [Psilocybe cubensis]|uniref:Uncharacterized protein n=2 Tax=Psilocybe cubensis TaxID=181762 RepID=A0A8H7XM63_PSICU|nr:Desumoylating isopeptidase 1 [Psilocybe cubensis]KAH9480191.1 Desumoylating isopeptidase 1 [Psilocybe cubensis]